MTLVVAEALGKDYRVPARLRELLRLRLFGPTVTALDGASLTVDAREIVVVLGMNGAGKSTLLKCLAGLLAPTRGRATVGGHDCAAGGAALRRTACYVAADARSFAWHLSGRANLEFFAALHGFDRAAARARVAGALAQVELDDTAADRRVAEYSTGMRQRLALARAFLGEPRVLLLDEPTAGLDPRAARQHREAIRRLAGEGRAILVATHLLDEAAELATAALVLDRGRVTYHGAFSPAIGASLA